MCKINYILYKYISNKYNSVPNFANIFGIPQKELSAVLLKENIVSDIASGIKICRALNLDMEKLVFNGEISEVCGDVDREAAVTEFRRLYMRLSGAEKQRVLTYMNSIKN
jgi:hypothetical protein